jgi:cyclase
MYSTLIVARMKSGAEGDVAGLFKDFDATDMPHLMGTRRRQLFFYQGLYFHLQDFDGDDGVERISHSRTDPRFVRISEDLKPFIQPYDPETWRSPADALSTRFYRWDGQA